MYNRTKGGVIWAGSELVLPLVDTLGALHDSADQAEFLVRLLTLLFRTSGESLL